MSHYSGSTLTPPPAHLGVMGHTPPPPHIHIHHSGGVGAGTMNTPPPPAHMNISDHRSSPGLQLLGHVAASPQLRIHGTPSPHLSVSAHSSGSPAHPAGLLTIDRPTSRESYSMTPPRSQVFPHAGVQPELLKVLRPHPPYSSPNSLTIPTMASSVSGMRSGTSSPTSVLQLAHHAALYQQHQQQQAAVAAAAQSSIANQIQQIQYLQAMQQQQQEQHQQAVAANERERQHVELLNNINNELSPNHHHHHLNQQHAQVSRQPSQQPKQTPVQQQQHHQHNHKPHSSAAGNESSSGGTLSTLYAPYNHIDPPEPSPHHQLKMLANVASSELGMLNSEAESTLKQRMMGTSNIDNLELNNNKNDVSLKLYNQRICNLNNFPTSTPYASSVRSHSIAMQRARAVCITGSAKSLDVLRETMQTRINEQIQNIIDGYIDTYFRPAADNIRENNGLTSISEEHIQCVCRKMLEEAGRIYMRSPRSRSATPSLPIADNMSDVGSTTSERLASRLPFARLKRSAQSDTESEKSTHKKRKRGRQTGTLGPSSLAKALASVKRDGPRWNPERLNNNSLFIMGSKANKALGLGNTRGRLYFKHPELFKYSGDTEDKMWLYEHHMMPVTGGKAYMMILEDIQELALSSEYKHVLDTAHLKGFTAPPWMVIKMQKQMLNLRNSSATAVANDVSAEASKAKLKNNLTSVAQQDQFDGDSDKNVPFKSAASSRKSLSDSKLGMDSPANTEEMELLSSEEQDDPQPVSPFGSAEDYAPVSPSNTTASSLKQAPAGPGGGTGSTGNLGLGGLTNDRFGIP